MHPSCGRILGCPHCDQLKLPKLPGDTGMTPLNPAGHVQMLGYLAALRLRYPGEVFLPGGWSPRNNPYEITSLPGFTSIPVFTFNAVNIGGGVITYSTNPPEELVELVAALTPAAIKQAVPYLKALTRFIASGVEIASDFAQGESLALEGAT